MNRPIAFAFATTALATLAPACSSAPDGADPSADVESSVTIATDTRPSWATACDSGGTAAWPRTITTRRGPKRVPVTIDGLTMWLTIGLQDCTTEIVGKKGDWSGKPLAEDANFCVHFWTTKTHPEYALLESAVVNKELSPDKPEPFAYFRDPFYPDCSGTGHVIDLDDPSQEAKTPVDYRKVLDGKACVQHDAKGNCVRTQAVNLMPQCPSCCTVTDDKIIAVIPQGTSDLSGVPAGMHAYAVIPAKNADGTSSWASIQVMPDGALGNAYVMDIPAVDKGKLVPGTYDIGAYD